MRDLLQQRKALIFRIIHRKNLPWVLQNGVHCRNSQRSDPNYVSIGNLDIIEKRQHWEVGTYPHGTLSDYVPFYFTPLSPMAYNIRTGYNGITQIQNEEILILHSSLPKLIETKVAFLFTDRHAILSTARFSSSLSDLKWVDWKILQARDFRRDNEDLGKVERYQAEALIHKLLPVSSLRGIACYDDATLESVNRLLDRVGIEIDVETKPGWYFR
jgi:hypothetical protein